MPGAAPVPGMVIITPAEPAISPSGVTISVAVDRYMAESPMKPGSKKDFGASISRFIELHGDVDLHAIRKSHVVAFKDMLLSLPSRMVWNRPGLVDTLKLSAEVLLMPKTRPRYPPEFRRQMIDLVRAGRSPLTTCRGSSSRRRSRSARGWPRPTSRRADGRRQCRVWQRRSGSWPGCGVRSAPSSRKPRPGLRERPARCRRALPVHEREPGPLAHRHHGARARRVQGGLPCVGPPAALGSHRCRRGLAETGSGRACDLASDVCGHRASMPICRPEGSGMAASGSRG